MLGTAQITARIPQRNSMLLLDRVQSLVPGVYAVASKAVTSTEWCYQPHVEGAPVGYPLGLLLESFNQTAALLTHHDHPSVGGSGESISILASYSDIEISGSVLPGDVMVHYVVSCGEVGGSELFSGFTTVSGQTVLRVGRSMLVRRDPAALQRT